MMMRTSWVTMVWITFLGIVSGLPQAWGQLPRLPNVEPHPLPSLMQGPAIPTGYDDLLTIPHGVPDTWLDVDHVMPAEYTWAEGQDEQDKQSEDARASGPIQLKPYGALWSDMVYGTSRTNPGAYTRWVYSDQQHGEPFFVIDARRSRLGLDVIGPELAGAASGGRVEIDFHGEFVNENRASVLLRHAYWEWKNESFRILVGQTWDVISPMLPQSLNYASGFNAGNIGFRRAQVRAERFIWFADDQRLLLQGSLNQDVVTDFATEALVFREAVDAPVVEGRLGWEWGDTNEPNRQLRIGISGHLGATGFDFLANGPPPFNLPPEDDARYRTWSCNLDLHVPIGDRFGLAGELFTGSNLSSYLGGIGQGVCACNRQAIRASGMWGEIWWDCREDLQTRVGYGLDDPKNEDFLIGRTYNQYIYYQLLWTVSNQISTGIEISYWQTFYQDRRGGLILDENLLPTQPGKAITVDWMFKYAF